MKTKKTSMEEKEEEGYQHRCMKGIGSFELYKSSSSAWAHDELWNPGSAQLAKGKILSELELEFIDYPSRVPY
jgi:hypothetical protein